MIIKVNTDNKTKVLHNIKRIGIPRAFYYYSYPGLWETFFKYLGIEPVISKASNKKMLDDAIPVSETENCLPGKLFDGHVMELAGKVDALFIPRIISMKKGYIACPKLGALPDAAVAEVAADIPVLIIEIDEKKISLDKLLIKLGKKLNAPAALIKTTVKKAFNKMEDRKKELMNFPEKENCPRFLLLGHPYVLHDSFLTNMILEKLKQMPVNVDILSFSENYRTDSYILWCTANKMHYQISHCSKEKYAGIIQISVFNCGCDSMMIDTFRPEIKKKELPYLVLLLDEHTGQAGITTRLEAFVDSVGWN